MRSERIRVHPELVKAIKVVADTLKISTQNASVIVFFGLDKKSVWDKTFPEAKVEYVRREAKRRIALSL